MNNFIFENATKTFFGKGCVKEYPDLPRGVLGDWRLQRIDGDGLWLRYAPKNKT